MKAIITDEALPPLNNKLGLRLVPEGANDHLLLRLLQRQHPAMCLDNDGSVNVPIYGPPDNGEVCEIVVSEELTKDTSNDFGAFVITVTHNLQGASIRHGRLVLTGDEGVTVTRLSINGRDQPLCADGTFQMEDIVAGAKLKLIVKTVKKCSQFQAKIMPGNMTGEKTVREYINALVWDQKPRIESWLIDYAMATDTEYVRAVSRKVLIAAVRRARQPGCRCDWVLVLESPQGTGKSRALRILAVEDAWFADKLPLDAREILETTEGKWFVEASELTLLSQNDVGALKACLSRQHDEARLAYQATVSRVPRQFLIVGTTDTADARRFCETEGYSRAETCNRRLLSVRVQRFDLERLRANRDQLWAEAAAAEATGEAINF